MNKLGPFLWFNDNAEEAAEFYLSVFPHARRLDELRSEGVGSWPVGKIATITIELEAQAFKRACSCFGLGWYFYSFAEMWVELNDYRQPKQQPQLPSWASPAAEKGAASVSKTSDKGRSAQCLQQWRGLDSQGAARCRGHGEDCDLSQ
jgi:hypothetical protein